MKLTQQKTTTKLLETIPNGIILTSSDQTVEYNNSAATLLLCEEATKNNLLNHSKNFKSLFPFIEKTTENNQYKNIEYELSNKTTLSLSTAVIPKSENQDTLLLLTDITDLKKLKQETEQKNRLVALSQMSSGISHEIGKPISDIKRDIITLNKQWDDRNQIKTIGANICDNVDAINKTCQSLLRLGKPKPIHIIQTDIYPLLQELQSLLKAELQKKDVNFQIHCEKPCLVSIDYPSILQVLLNLSINAIESFSKNNETLALSVSFQESTCVITLEDSGSGISKAHLTQIYNPFFSTKQGSTGLGLTIAHRIIQDHQGEIRCRSTVSEGTTFSISLPNKVTSLEQSHD